MDATLDSNMDSTSDDASDHSSNMEVDSSGPQLPPSDPREPKEFDVSRNPSAAYVAEAEEKLGIKLKHLPSTEAVSQVHLALKGPGKGLKFTKNGRNAIIPDDDTMVSRMLEGSAVDKQYTKIDPRLLTTTDILDAEEALGVTLRHYSFSRANDALRLMYHRASQSGNVHQQLESLAKAGKLNIGKHKLQPLPKSNKSAFWDKKGRRVACLPENGPRPKYRVSKKQTKKQIKKQIKKQKKQTKAGNQTMKEAGKPKRQRRKEGRAASKGDAISHPPAPSDTQMSL